MTFNEKTKIEEFGIAFGIVMGFVGLLDILWRVWNEALKSKQESSGGSPRPFAVAYEGQGTESP